MEPKTRTSPLFALVLSLALLFAVLPVRAMAAQQPPVPNAAVSVHFFTRALTLEFGYQNSAWIERIQSLQVDGTPYEQVDSTLKLGSGTYILQPSDGQITLPPSLRGTVTCRISAQGYEDLILTLDAQALTVTPVSSAGNGVSSGEQEEHPAFSLTEEAPGYLKLTVTGADRFVEGITAVERIRADSSTALTAWSYKPTLNDTSYYLAPSSSSIYFNNFLPSLRSGDLLRISSQGRRDLLLKITLSGGDSRAELVSEDVRPDAPLTLHVRLAGAFEPALANQKGYDAVTGATSSVTVNKNSSVEVQCALVKEGDSPAEEDWTPLHKSGLTVRQADIHVDISPQDSGMTGVLSTLNSALTLSGTPTKKGAYQISVTLEDSLNRKATSNALPFLVCGGDETLEDQLTLDHARQAQDGAYLYDMVPWSIRTFGGRDETVTVPAPIKAWFGSHASGTYGKLGYSLPEGQEPVQTLVIPAGCDLTLVNMDVLSSVKLTVQSGGRLSLQDSIVQGVVEVEKDGVFSMNYDAYHGKFLTGASLNGQLRLKSGAVLENAAIYSNTNFIANGSQARKNTRPVAAVLGDVTLRGQVFLRGDEAPTGTDPKTGRSYAGQTGLSVTGGTLTLADGALLAVYGGGMQAATSVGGTAVLLDRGAIAGAGTLVAVGGDGTFDRGGDAVSGTGSISAAKAYLQGGAAAFPRTDGIAGGRAAADTVSAPTALKNDGPVWRNEQDNPNIPRWSGASSVPTPADAQQIIDYVTRLAPAVSSAPAGGGTRTAVRTPSTAPVRYGIRVDKSISHGSVSVSGSQAEAGSLVQITVQPERGYVLESLAVTDRLGKPVNLTRRGTAYRFSMPASQVSIDARFVPEAQPVLPEQSSFRDVAPSDYFYAAVRWAAENQVTRGASQALFAPDALCTRAQVVALLWRAAGSPTSTGGSVPFRDVPPEAYYSEAVRWAAEQGITSGAGTDVFRPDAVVTRAQAAAFLYRAAGAPAVREDAPFSDVEDGSYYAAAAQWARQQGISHGTGGGRFSPDAACTRAQIISLLYRGVQQSLFSW